MRAATIAMTLGATVTMAVADDDHAPGRRLQDLLDRGFSVIAEGELLDVFECAPEAAGITLQQIKQGPGCSSGNARYGSFKRLKARDNEFVCISFRDWTCYPSSNER
jgi:hypothetical protein